MAPSTGRGQSLALLPRTGQSAVRLRWHPGIHPRRIFAGDGASVRRLLGVRDHRVLLTDGALWIARRLSLPDRPAPSERHRGDPGLGAGPFSYRRILTRPL